MIEADKYLNYYKCPTVTHNNMFVTLSGRHITQMGNVRNLIIEKFNYQFIWITILSSGHVCCVVCSENF